MIKHISYITIGIAVFMGMTFATGSTGINNNGSGLPGGGVGNNLSIYPELDPQYVDTFIKKDFRLMDDVLFPSWQPSNIYDPKRDSQPSDSRTSLRQILDKGNHYVVGVIGSNNEQFLLMDFFSRVADLMIILIVPIIFIILIYNGIQWITDTNGSNRSKVSTNILNSIIGLVVVACAYSLVKIIYFILTQ